MLVMVLSILLGVFVIVQSEKNGMGTLKASLLGGAVAAVTALTLNAIGALL